MSRADAVHARSAWRASEVARLAPPSVTLADPDRFVLRARVRHVLAEAARVAAAEEALRAGDLRALGALLDESHASGAADYGTSTPAADALVAAGARGGRARRAADGRGLRRRRRCCWSQRERAAGLLAALDRGVLRAARRRRRCALRRDAVGRREVARVDCPGAVC